MSMTDPVADLLCRIRNAHMSKHDRLDVPMSKLKLEICKLMREQGYLGKIEPLEDDPGKKGIRIYLRYDDAGQPVIRHMRRVSKPGRRVYQGADEIRPVLNGLGVGVFSTSKGLLTDAAARQERVGGEYLCEIW